MLIVLVLIFIGSIFFWGLVKNVPVQQAAVPTQQTPETNQPAPSEAVKISSGPGGQYLVDSRGMTLYYFTKDAANKSNCAGGCLAVWPSFYAENLAVNSPLKMVDFSIIAGSTGQEQIAYKGRPLYYYSKDLKPGDILGNGLNGFWFLVKP